MEKLNTNERYKLSTKLLVREPVDNLCQKIEDNLRHTIVLGGGSGVGKSTVLNTLENRNIGKENPFITMHFNAESRNLSGVEEIDKQHLKLFCEIDFCSNLYFYLKTYYTLSYNKHFSESHNEIKELNSNFVDYINSVNYDKPFIANFDMTEKVQEIVEKMKEVLPIDTLSIGIDRFDWTYEVNPQAQENLQQYFDIFDKVVISTDDKKAEEYFKSRKQYFEVNYAKDLEVLEEIIKRRVDDYLKEYYFVDFNREKFDRNVYKELLKVTKGNLKLIIEIVNGILDEYKWNPEVDFQKAFDIQSEKNVESVKRRIMMMSNKPHLYIK